MIIHKKENIMDCTEEILAHQVNCRGIMGSGVALFIKQKHPEVYEKYHIYCIKNNRSASLMGNVLFAEAENASYIIANCFGQQYFGRGMLHTDYNAVRSYLIKLKEKNKSIALPLKIGCGLAGGDWKIVYGIINEIFSDYEKDVVLYEYNPNIKGGNKNG